MASRKTYFGIGLPKDPSDPESGPLPAPNATDQEDRSSPTVVDDERVAEGLKQLRSWYQEEGPHAANPPPARGPGAAPPASYARPTAVGHATAPPAGVQPQRPFAPDPMRATMYGHDVHRFDLEAIEAAQAAAAGAPAAPAATPVPVPQPAPSTALMIPAYRQEDAARMRTPVPDPMGQSPSGAFQLARQGEAERLYRPGGARRSSPGIQRRSRRVPVSSLVFFGLGIVALAGAVAVWYQADGTAPTHAAPAPTIPANPQPGTTPPPVPPLGQPGAAQPAAPVKQPTTIERSIVPAALKTGGAPSAPTPTPTPTPTKPSLAPRSERSERASGTSSASRHRTHRTTVEIVKPSDAGPTDVETPPDPDKKTETSTAPETVPRKKTEATAAPETPPRKATPETAPRKRTEPGAKGRVGADNDATLPPSDDQP